MVWGEEAFAGSPRQDAAHSSLRIAPGTTRRSQGRGGPRAGPRSVRELGESRPAPCPAPPRQPGPARSRAAPSEQSGCHGELGASLRPFPLSPPRSPSRTQLPACGERPVASLARGLGVPARWVAYLSYLHPRRPTSSRCPRPRSCSPRFRRSPPPSHRDGSSPSYPLGNGLAFSSRAVASHSRRPARPLPLQ